LSNKIDAINDYHKLKSLGRIALVKESHLSVTKWSVQKAPLIKYKNTSITESVAIRYYCSKLGLSSISIFVGQVMEENLECVGDYIPYIRYIGMCRPKGFGF